MLSACEKVSPCTNMIRDYCTNLLYWPSVPCYQSRGRAVLLYYRIEKMGSFKGRPIPNGIQSDLESNFICKCIGTGTKKPPFHDLPKRNRERNICPPPNGNGLLIFQTILPFFIALRYHPFWVPFSGLRDIACCSIIKAF